MFLSDKYNLSSKRRQLLIVVSCMVFCAFSLAGYWLRADYYHRQSDQFAYLSMADTWVNSGRMMNAAELPITLPPTANYGAALLMSPLVKWGVDGVFRAISLFYALLALASIFPLNRLLAELGADRRERLWIIVIYFTSFPIAMWRIWPVNEGPSLFFIAWWLYLAITTRSYFFLSLCAAIAPVFRIHILIYEFCLLVYSLATKQPALMWRAVYSMAVSLGAMVAFRFLIPYHQQNLAGQFHLDNVVVLVKGILTSLLFLFIPQAYAEWSAVAQAIAPWVGLLLWGYVIWAFRANLSSSRLKNLQLLGALVIAAFAISLCFSTVLIARYFCAAYFWIVTILILAASPTARWRKWLPMGWLVGNLIVLSTYLLTASSDPQFSTLEEAKELSPMAESYSYVYLDADFTMHPRYVYAYFRRPSGKIDQLDLRLSPRFLFLAYTISKRSFPGCKVDGFQREHVKLLNVDCSKPSDDSLNPKMPSGHGAGT